MRNAFSTLETLRSRIDLKLCTHSYLRYFCFSLHLFYFHIILNIIKISDIPWYFDELWVFYYLGAFIIIWVSKQPLPNTSPSSELIVNNKICRICTIIMERVLNFALGSLASEQNSFFYLLFYALEFDSRKIFFQSVLW